MGRIPPQLPPQFGRFPQPSQQQRIQGTCASTQQTGTAQIAAFEKFKAEQFSHIMGHEKAHQSAGGKFAGGIHIDYDSNGVAIGGHVPIRMPGLNPAKPEESLNDAKVVFGAAVAPGADASGQDLAVAAQAQAIMGQAQVLMSRKNKKSPQS